MRPADENLGPQVARLPAKFLIFLVGLTKKHVWPDRYAVLIPDIPEAARDWLPVPCGRPWHAAFRAAATTPPASGKATEGPQQQQH
ncbi:hypothetical protein NHX12_000902 [Muraenolepis orangiensis]|uniref:Uncharacterized protein n=1 Tax=Muraenolepis orangiensis TaxID=630683 RepID=A0A9Q0DZQ5_9TELE|nr:hypothetical protein NHX12_000902 [Muraenolepis orangiensis]